MVQRRILTVILLTILVAPAWTAAPPPYPPSEVRRLQSLAKQLVINGKYEKAQGPATAALALARKLYPSDHEDLAQCLNRAGEVARLMREPAKALSYYEESLKIRQRLALGKDTPALAAILNNLGSLWHQELRQIAKARPYYEESLAMRQRLYPEHLFKDGTEELATSLNNWGTYLNAVNKPAEAVPFLEKALEMRRKLPAATALPDVAKSHNNLGTSLLKVGRKAEAIEQFKQAVGAYRSLYQDEGHPNLATALSNFGHYLHITGDLPQALSVHREALTMRRKLFPSPPFVHGHPDVARSMIGMADVLEDMGEPAEALPLRRKAMEIVQHQVVEIARSFPEELAMDNLAKLPPARDNYLTLTRNLHSTDVYPLVWQTRGVVSRVYEQRHLAAMTAVDAKARGLVRELSGLRQERARGLLAGSKSEGDVELVDLDRRIDELDRALAALQPEAATIEKMARSTPVDLQRALPANAVFIDLLRYGYFEGKFGTPGAKRTASYVAFVVRRDGIERVELGPAQPIANAVRQWRDAIRVGTPEEAAARKVSELVWRPLSKCLPRSTKTVYLAPDLILTTLPWAALPVEGGRVLLEDYTLCAVPHGPFLLGHLAAERSKDAGRPSLLAVGGVAYGDGQATWTPLKGTEKEVNFLSGQSKSMNVTVLRGEEARADAVTKVLPSARFAHLATHGYFTDSESGDKARGGPILRSPMVLAGLVCAGANRPGTPGRGILTADAVSTLDLRQMHLAVLSACESGLGETTGGEGVFGLPRAFHVGGCRNVIASLWKVIDDPTAALMNRFYTHLWNSEKGLTPREALRLAQLDIYHNPDQVKGWAERGIGKQAVAIPVKPGAKTSPTKVWAAWVLSGPGD